MTTLVLFDIDGTLVLTGGAGLRAMALAFQELFDVPDAFGGMPMAGRTDAWILSDAAAAHGIPRDAPALARFPDVYLRHLAVEIEKPHPRKTVMPGVRDLLDALARRDDVYIALLTGNYEAAARLKLEHFDLWRYFPCGAFGDGAADRNSLVPKAIARVAAAGGPAFAARDAVVIGDTPLDVACAKVNAARAVGVATGPHGVADLRAAGADAVLTDLSETENVVRLLIAD
ncbi:MAG: haloacid dehalogenase-like hydrolase [Acidobacteria bacterium]|nr:haloacid dehalogenase-like hydrolase [Acidobacteriota bacterium]